MYGHPGHGIAYIVPAKQIFQDIEKRFDSPISLPLTALATSGHPKSLDALKPQVTPRNKAPGSGTVLADITIVVKYCRDIYLKCIDAGGEYGDIGGAIHGLLTVLIHLTHDPDSPSNSDPSIWGRQGEPIIVDVYVTLHRLERLLQNRFGANIKSQPSFRGKLLDKMTFGSDEVAQLGAIRVKLIWHKRRLTRFLDAIQLHQSGKIRNISVSSTNQLDIILDKVDLIISRMGQKISQKSVDEKEVWKQVRKELIAEGFSAGILAQHEVSQLPASNIQGTNAYTI